MRFVSFSFDDGPIDSAQAVPRVLGPDHATGRVLPNTAPIDDRKSVGRNPLIFEIPEQTG